MMMMRKKICRLHRCIVRLKFFLGFWTFPPWCLNQIPNPTSPQKEVHTKTPSCNDDDAKEICRLPRCVVIFQFFRWCLNFFRVVFEPISKSHLSSEGCSVHTKTPSCTDGDAKEICRLARCIGTQREHIDNHSKHKHGTMDNCTNDDRKVDDSSFGDFLPFWFFPDEIFLIWVLLCF